MRIAITGAAGYIGGWLGTVLRERGHEVFPQDVTKGAHGECFDLVNRHAREAWLGTSEPHLVVHLAARYGRVWCENDLIRTAEVNAGLTAELARDCARAGIRLAYVSSSEVYGVAASGAFPVSEDTMLYPMNMYGLTKKLGEETCRVYAPRDLAIIRLNMPYGPPAVLPLPGVIPHHSGRVGNVGFNALHTMLWQAYHGMPITVHKGTERTFTWIGDAIQGMVLVIESGKEGTWNVCRDDEPVSMITLAQLCVNQAGNGRSEIIEEDPPRQVTRVKRLSGARLRQLGWKPGVSLEQGLAETLPYVSMFDRESRWRGSA